MKAPIRLRLTLSHLLVLAFGMLLAGSLAWLAVEQLYLSTQRDNLLALAELTALSLDETPFQGVSPDVYSQTTNISPGIHSRLLSETGAVIIGVPDLEGEILPLQDPALDPGYIPAEELIERLEIQSALAGTADTAVRRIAALGGKRVLYAAAPVFSEEGQVASLIYLAMPLPSGGLPADLIFKLVGSALAGALAASLIGMLLARSIASPLEVLDQAAAEVARGRLDQQVPLPSRIQELDHLGQSFNQMTESLRRSEALKNSFIADVTHELRTPLTVLKGTVETLEDGALDDREGRGKLLTTMKRETERLIQLVNQLLVLARSDADALALALGPLDLADLARERAGNFALLAEQKEVRIEVVDPAPGVMLARGDRGRTAQVLDNLLDNALRYAPPGSTVTVTLREKPGLILCAVQDQGPGIPPQDLSRIFDRFYRVQPARDRTSGGSGLGLAIARALVEAQGGSIQASSPEGSGACLEFSLPPENLP